SPISAAVLSYGLHYLPAESPIFSDGERAIKAVLKVYLFLSQQLYRDIQKSDALESFGLQNSRGGFISRHKDAAYAAAEKLEINISSIFGDLKEKWGTEYDPPKLSPAAV